jgi:hypothetical protein
VMMIEIPGRGAPTTVRVLPVAGALARREGVLAVASVLAAWATWRISIWHEVATAYGYEAFPGYSERLSSFSPEDLYSNALGVRLGMGVVSERAFGTDEEYDRAFAAFLALALERLEAQPVEVARAVMASLDGRWWDSERRLPDPRLVLRRSFATDDPVVPWRAEDAFAPGEVPEPLASACAGARTRPLHVPSGIGHVEAADVVSMTWAPEGWGDDLPYADPDRRVVDVRSLDALVAEVHAMFEAELGPGFDQPGPIAAP